MIRLAVINPNSTVSMTDKIAAAACAAAPGAAIDARTCAGAPPAIQGPADGAAAVPYMLAELLRAEAEGADAAIIACFDDTGLAEARARARIPVIGIGEAAFHAAMMLGGRYSVVTTLAVSVPVIAANIRNYGLASHCARVRASDVPVLDLEHAASGARTRISAEIAAAIAEDGVDCVVLGCAGMADLAASLAAEHAMPVIDGVAAACGFARTLAHLVKAPDQRGTKP